MYGLFNYSYDYYEFEDLQCVSESKEKLETYYNDIESPAYLEKKPNLVDSDQHNLLYNEEEEHYHIKLIKVI